MKRIGELEGLRGVLAWWVVVGHLLDYSGLTNHNGFPLKYVHGGAIAVDVFVILSGFVIFYLLIEKQETFGAYITRRFFRIYPVFVVFLVLALLLNSMHEATFGRLGWSGGPWVQDYLSDIHRVDQHLWAQIAVHLVMLHGILPDRLLYHSGLSILPPAWSISLEWQFYLVAPFLLYLARRRNWGWGLLAGVCICSPFLFRRVGSYAVPSFLPLQLPHFLLGMLSCVFWLRIAQDPGALARFRGYLWVVPILVIGFTDDKALLIWSVVLTGITIHRLGGEDRASILVHRLLDSRPCSFLGRVSYSTYLCHIPVLWVVMIPLSQVAWCSQHKLGMLAGLCVVGLPAVLLCSYASYRWIEAPGMKLGAALAKGMGRTAPMETLQLVIPK